MTRTVMTIADLEARHLGHTIRIPDLHQPGTDWDAPRVDVVATLDALTTVPYSTRTEVWVRLRPKGAALDRPLPLAWPCFLASEDPEIQP